MIEYKTHQSEFCEPQVDLIWEITDKWKYGYQTSYETVKNAYNIEGFDPNSRIYAFSQDKMLGFVGANISEDAEGNKSARMRLPLVLPSYDENFQVSKELMGKIEDYLRERGVTKISTPAGVGLGNTVELAESLGFERGNEVFRRTNVNVDELKISGNTDGIIEFEDKYEDQIKNLFMYKMGMSEQQGASFFDWALKNSRRKWLEDPNAASWQFYKKDGDDIAGFSYLMRSDHQPHMANSMPIYFSNDTDPKKVIDRLLSAHIKKMPDIQIVGNYLLPNLYNNEVLYNSFGFKFDPAFFYSKAL